MSLVPVADASPEPADRQANGGSLLLVSETLAL